MTWALKRQLIYIGIILLVLGVFAFFVIYPYLKELPTCNDGRQNGDELGVDCGGSCVLACKFQVDDISILWARTFQVIPGRYNAVAYLENHNKNAVITKLKYRFRFSDKDNIYIGKREGEVFIPAGKKFAIFEPGIGVGNSIPIYTTFEFIEAPVWTTVPEDKLNQLKVLVSDINLENQDTEPHLSAKIKNDSLFTIPEVGVVVLLYDAKGNAISTSRTFIDLLGPEEIKEIDFTWREPIKEEVVAKEIIPVYNIFSVQLK